MLARRNLLDFTTHTYRGGEYQVGWHHRVLCEKLDQFATGHIRRLMVFMPPQHGKSELVSRRLPAYLFGRQPTKRIIACSYTADLSSAMNRDVQKVMDSTRYQHLFPGVRLGSKNIRTPSGPSPLRNSDEFEVIGPDGAYLGGYYKSAGVGCGITGRPMDFGIIDDPIKGREEAESQACRDKVWGWYNGDFLSRAHGQTSILLTCTRWNVDDLAGRLLRLQDEEPKADKWEVVCFPAICEDMKHADDPRQPGEALWPERHPLELLEAKRAASPYDWASLYQQNPRGAGVIEWPDEYFGPHIWFDRWPDDLQCRILYLDPSKGSKDQSGDMSAFVMLGVDRAMNIWVDADMDNTRTVESMYGSGDVGSMAGDGVRLFVQFCPQAFCVETNGFQEWVPQALYRYAAAMGITLPLWGINNTENKDTRIRSLGTYFAQRRFRVRNTPGGRMLVAQLREFPAGRYKDGPDALKGAETMANRLMHGEDDVDGAAPYLLAA